MLICDLFFGHLLETSLLSLKFLKCHSSVMSQMLVETRMLFHVVIRFIDLGLRTIKLKEVNLDSLDILLDIRS
jgi:hypothetical protein